MIIREPEASWQRSAYKLGLKRGSKKQGYPGGTSGKEPTCNAGDLRDVGLSPGSGRSPGGGHGNLLQYSCLENPMDRGAWYSPWGRKESDVAEVT